MSEAKGLLIDIMRDHMQATHDRLRAVELLAALHPETFQPEPPARTPAEDGALLYQMLQEAYRAGWDDSGGAWNAEYPRGATSRQEWIAARDQALCKLLERHDNA